MLLGLGTPVVLVGAGLVGLYLAYARRREGQGGVARAGVALIVGGLAAYAPRQPSQRLDVGSMPRPSPVGAALPGRWVWPVPRWNGRAPVISDGFESPRPGLPRHGGVDIMFERVPADPFKVGSPNGTPHYVMPDGFPSPSQRATAQCGPPARPRTASRWFSTTRRPRPPRSTRISRSCSSSQRRAASQASGFAPVNPSG